MVKAQVKLNFFHTYNIATVNYKNASQTRMLHNLVTRKYDTVIISSIELSQIMLCNTMTKIYFVLKLIQTTFIAFSFI